MNKNPQSVTLPPMFSKLDKQMRLEFDYEINSIKLDDNDELNSKMYYFDKKTNSYRIVNYNSLNDSLNLEFKEDETKIKVKKVINKAWCLKRLVSKKKRRFENENFDLDMAYVTKRVIAMGYPATGFEKSYRNSINEVIRFFRYYHNDNVKIYNLCIEKDRIYPKTYFPKSQVALFPAKDHNPCPIKLILEFCVDICLYLIKNPEGVAAIHCKAGKGRTGVMICSYLIFSGICKNSDEAFQHYAESRTYNKKGVTIPSQKRYIQYFESFLETNFCPPYIFLIPKIVKYHINMKTKNILQNFSNDETYFISPNEFRIKHIRIGPLNSKSSLDVKICDFVTHDIKFEKIKKTFEQAAGNASNSYYFKIDFEEIIKINSDIKISINGAGLDFYFWANLWYSTLTLVKTFLDNFHRDILEDHKLQKLSRVQSNITENDNTRRELIGKNLFKKDLDTANRATSFNNMSEIVIENSNFNHESQENFNEKNKINDEEIILKNKKNVNYAPNTSHELKEITPCDHEKSIDYKNRISEPNEDDNLFDIIYKLKHNTDLNILVKTINKILVNDGKKCFDKTDMTITLKAKELDKFSKTKDLSKDFGVNICYSLNDS